MSGLASYLYFVNSLLTNEITGQTESLSLQDPCMERSTEFIAVDVFIAQSLKHEEAFCAAFCFVPTQVVHISACCVSVYQVRLMLLITVAVPC